MLFVAHPRSKNTNCSDLGEHWVKQISSDPGKIFTKKWCQEKKKDVEELVIENLTWKKEARRKLDSSYRAAANTINDIIRGYGGSRESKRSYIACKNVTEWEKDTEQDVLDAPESRARDEIDPLLENRSSPRDNKNPHERDATEQRLEKERWSETKNRARGWNPALEDGPSAKRRRISDHHRRGADRWGACWEPGYHKVANAPWGHRRRWW